MCPKKSDTCRAASSELARGRCVLVTGGSGFLGSQLCRRLIADGAVVHATSRSQRSAPPIWSQPNLEDADEVRDLLLEVRPEVVYHFAGQVSAAPDLDLVIPIYQSFLTSTINVMVAASESGCRRVVLAGSLTEPENRTEVAASPYAAAKSACSIYAKMFHALYGLSVVTTRPFMAYGPGQNPDKVVPYVAASLMREEAPELSSGALESDWVYVSDVTEGLVRAGFVDGLGGQDVDLGTGILTSLQDVIGQVAELIGASVAPRFGARPDRPMERPRRADVAQSERQLLGWKSEISLEEGLRRTVDALKGE